MKKENNDDQRLHEIETRTQAATPGPWEIEKVEAAHFRIKHVAVGLHNADAKFIAHSREDFPWLTSKYRQMKNRITQLEKENEILKANCSKSVMRRLKTQTDIDFSER